MDPMKLISANTVTAKFQQLLIFLTVNLLMVVRQPSFLHQFKITCQFPLLTIIVQYPYVVRLERITAEIFCRCRPHIFRVTAIQIDTVQYRIQYKNRYKNVAQSNNIDQTRTTLPIALVFCKPMISVYFS